MAEVEQKATLLVRSGPRRGKRFNLKGGAFRIGKDSNSDLVLTDEFVSPLHTVVEFRDDVWIATNRGVNGTLLNRTAIEGSRPLAPGDVLQVGGETLIEFGLKEKRKRQKADKTVGGSEEAKPLWQRPAVLGGLGGYFVLLIAAAVFLSTTAGSGGSGLSRATADDLVARSRAFLESDAPRDSEPIAGFVRPSDPEDPASTYYALVSAREHEAPPESTQPLVDDMIDRVDRALFEAWRLEQQRNWSAAIDTYRGIQRMLPTLRAPVTEFAIGRVEALREYVEE